MSPPAKPGDYLINLSDAPLVDYFLTIFNRMAGSADEMGGFVLGLATTLQESKAQIDEANQNTEKALQDMAQAVEEFALLKKQDSSSKDVIEKLKIELAKLIQSRDMESLAAISHQTAAKQIYLEEIQKQSFSKNSEFYQALKNMAHMKQSFGLPMSEKLKSSLFQSPVKEVEHLLPTSMADLKMTKFQFPEN